MDIEPFDRIVTRHGVTVLRVCRAVLGPTAEAEDAWSETFLAALQAWDGLRADSNVEGWLVTIAHRKAIDIVRQRTRHAVPVETLPEGRGARRLDREASGMAQPDALPDDDLWAALAALPDRQREAVALHHVGGLPHAEVAVILESTPAAVRKASSDGIKRLRATVRPPRQAAPAGQGGLAAQAGLPPGRVR